MASIVSEGTNFRKTDFASGEFCDQPSHTHYHTVAGFSDRPLAAMKCLSECYAMPLERGFRRESAGAIKVQPFQPQ
jgi:hypothetical protein